MARNFPVRMLCCLRFLPGDAGFGGCRALALSAGGRDEFAAPEALHARPLAGTGGGRQVADELRPVVLRDEPGVEDTDDSPVGAGADQPPEALLEPYLRLRHGVVAEPVAARVHDRFRACL